MEEKAAIEELRVLMHRTLKKSLGAEGFNYAWNEEKIGGQSVPHFHLHILPRKTGDTGVYQYEPREFLYRPIPADQRNESREDELVVLIQQIRTAL